MVLTFFESCLHDRPRHPVKELAKRYFVSRTLQGAFVGGTLHREYAIRLGIPPHAIETGYDAVANAHFAAVADSARQDAQALRRQFGLPGAYFLYVGRFAPEKNVAGLLRAYALYRKRHRLDPWPLVLVGSGPQEAHLRSLAAELGLTDVYWPGFRPIDELPMFYALATCFVLPSTSEPWGLVVNEALATGLPVLVSDRCGCAPELVQEGRNGFCFAPEDVPRLAQLMVSMACADQPTRVAFGEMSRRIVEPYSTEEWARRLTRLVRNLLSEGSHRK
jgi:glycosyltransferase involved in cell wall biosynthesis